MSRPGVTRARLTQFEVRRALKSVMSEIPAARLRHIDEGADLDAWAVDEAWVARFSLDEEIGANLDREIALLEQIRHDMPIPCPEHVAVGGMDDAYPFRFTVSKMLPGISGEVLRPGRKRWPGLADQLAGFLSTLHATPLEVGAAAGLMHDRNVLPLAELADEAAVALDARTLDAFPLAAQGGAARFAAELATPPDHAKPPDVVAHSDVKPEHLLLTEDGARITAVLDWADTCLTPAEIDLAGPVIWLGPGFANEVLRRYEGRVDGGILERAVFRARCGLIRYLHGRLIGIYNTPWEPLHAQAAAAFAPGPGEPGFG